MSKFAMKITSESEQKKYLVPLREYTGLGISEIKGKIERQDFIAETDANDVKEMEKLKGLIDKLLELGADVKIYDSDVYGEGDYNYQEITLEEFNNNISLLKKVLDELQDYDDVLSEY